MISIGTAILGTVALYVTVKVVGRVRRIWRTKKALDGKYGKEAKWMMEYVRDGDQEFIEAAKSLDTMEQKEVSIIAESKEELRERTISRANEP